MTTTNLMTVKEAAARVGLKESKFRYEMTLDNHTWQGAPIIQIGGRLYFERADIERIARAEEAKS